MQNKINLNKFPHFCSQKRIYFNMKKDYILVIDSGVGGLSTLAETMKILPANYIYYADNKNSPYGSHSNEEILIFLTTIINKILSRNKVSLIVLACNTATTSCIGTLRKIYKNIEFVGTEPAIKLASKSQNNILLVATPLTTNQNRTAEIIKNTKKYVTIMPMPSLARSVDEFLAKNSYFSYAKILKDVYKIVSASKNQDAIVLGCTHYCFLYDIFRKITNIPIFDGNLGVAKQVKFLSLKQKIAIHNYSSVKFEFSNPTNFTKQNYKKILSQILAKKQRLC